MRSVASGLSWSELTACRKTKPVFLVTMAGLAIGYTKQTGDSRSYNIVFTDFTSTDLPRQFENAASFGRSQTGALIQSGPRYQQKYMWTIDCMLDTDKAEALADLYRDWDLDRSEGLSVAVGITDATFGSPLTAEATFTTAPSFTYASPRKTIVSFGLKQI